MTAKMADSFYKFMLNSHDQAVHDMVQSSMDQSEYWNDALDLIDGYEAAAQNDHKHASEATDFIGLCQRARSEIKRLALMQRIDKDDREKD